MSETTTYFDLMDALAEPGCPVCRLVGKAVSQQIDSLNYEFVLDPGFRRQITASWGFCNLHGEDWLDVADPLGTALLYEAILVQIDEELDHLHRPGNGGLSGILSSLTGQSAAPEQPQIAGFHPTLPCPLCDYRDYHERALIGVLLDHFEEESLGTAYSALVGLCVPHLRQALSMSRSVATTSSLREQAGARHARLREELREVQRKRDYRFRLEESGSEYGAPDRAVRVVTGTHGVRDR